MRKKATLRTVLASFLAGLLLWTPLARSESVFDARADGAAAENVTLPFRMASAGSASGEGTAALYASLRQDSLEIFDVELAEEEEESGLFKEIAMVAMVAGAVGYMVYMMIGSDEDEEETVDDGGGKTAPPLPFSRLW